MRFSRRTLLLSAAAFALPRVSSVRADASLALAVFVHPQNRVTLLDVDEFEAIFTTTRLHWDHNERISAFNLPPYSEARTELDRTVLRLSPDAASKLWVDRRIRGGAPPPRQLPDPQIMVRVVATLPGAIGYAPEALVDASVKVVARIKNGAVTKP